MRSIAAKRVLMLNGLEGNVIPVKVDTAAKAFDPFKVGDAVRVRQAKP